MSVPSDSNSPRVDEAQLWKALEGVYVEDFDANIVEAGIIDQLRIDDDQEEEKSKINVVLKMPYAGNSEIRNLAQAVWNTLYQLPGVEALGVDLDMEIPHGPENKELPFLAGVKHVIAVASGKGGVGKSTTAVNIAYGLAAEGASVGILDADIYGPSIPHMLGLGDKRPEMVDGKIFKPLEAHGVKAMSMGFLVTEQTPMVWRGPMASGALQQILTQTDWGELDYLIVDMPPGTGDIQLTLAQKIALSGAVIVTTPQNIALLDAQKGIEMFRKVDVPVLGVVENMSTHICSQCGHEEPIFGTGGGDRIAEGYETRLLGQLPLSLKIRDQADKGKPVVVSNPSSEWAESYRKVARRVGAQVAMNSMAASSLSLEITDE
ncbi:iron-sulfur cluster carrier protein ApbC [Marinibactrum halimedae]|uniref:Iron-sulfur cluster carrier protein n=1 Tax=Marinibactrum halimedae TaxID=1444977 RepID=A0AA37WNZ8_9GAMM|nr:iron-sulfur cluster carrier protein ApbC [Marinibactrum halimedae]MCD9460205.1 iron-sulfur cluster carrier protein ApbC [Marinibactrum halimedae]GLS27963.1 iron-sulfur cluster carrier protein [Marinibactrum halimedae]